MGLMTPTWREVREAAIEQAIAAIRADPTLTVKAACDAADAPYQTVLLRLHEAGIIPHERRALKLIRADTARRLFHPQRSGPADAERCEAMMRLYFEEHHTLEQIGTAYGVTRERARQIIASHPDTEARRTAMRERREAAIAAALDALRADPNLSVKRAAEQFDVSDHILRARVKQAGMVPTERPGGIPRRRRTDPPHGVRRALNQRLRCRCDICTAALREYNRTMRVGMWFRAVNGDPTVPHGTISGFTNWGCRCERCEAVGPPYTRKQLRRWHKRVLREVRNGTREIKHHGTQYAYMTYGCRCDRCKAAHAEFYQHLRRRRATG